MSQAKPLILLPCEPFNAREIDPDFEPERQAAKASGFATALIDQSRVLEEAATAAESHWAVAIRGWFSTSFLTTPGQRPAKASAREHTPCFRPMWGGT
jgi:hypothetical protein